MTLDDRMRAAQQRRLEDTRDRLDHRLDPAMGVNRQPAFGGRLLAAAAGLIILVGGAVMVSRLVADEAVIETDAVSPTNNDGVAEPSEADPDQPPALDVAPTDSPDSDEEQSAEGVESAAEQDAGGLETSATEVVSEFDAGLATNACPSGRRASLETATLRYIGDSQGWNRLDDLVDEQDGPYYFVGWEPGFPDSVTVEVELEVPALAADVRIAQDPNTPVRGPIVLTVGEETVTIELGGPNVWKAHTFEAPTEVERFTINRSSTEANVMEVMLCLVEPE